MRSVYYNLYDGGHKIGAYTPMELQTMIQCSRSLPCEYAADGKTYHGRYTFERVRECIEAMEDEREKLLLTYRYLRGMRWTAICELMKHSWQHVHRIHASALKNFRTM